MSVFMMIAAIAIVCVLAAPTLRDPGATISLGTNVILGGVAVTLGVAVILFAYYGGKKIRMSYVAFEQDYAAASEPKGDRKAFLANMKSVVNGTAPTGIASVSTPTTPLAAL